MLAAGIIPRSWHRYTVPAGLTVIQWVTDFSQRIKQLQHISKEVGTNSSSVLKVTLETYCQVGNLGIILLCSLPFLTDSTHLAGGPVHPRGLHHGHTTVCSPG